MAREPVLAAGGIVLRREQALIALVRLRKRDEWVLPKGKLNDGETPRAAARREVVEETGHDVTVHEFLGTLVYEAGGRSKVVHYWRMEAGGGPAHELMDDVRAVDWLPLDAAVARLSRGYERAFLANVGPLAVSVRARKLKAKAAPAPRKPRSKPTVAPELPPLVPQPELASPALRPEETVDAVGDVAVEEMPIPDLDPALPETAVAGPDCEPAATAVDQTAMATEEVGPPKGPEELPKDTGRRSLAQKVRDWLGHAA
jgi:8-oxo-dGTP diphosphatase